MYVKVVFAIINRKSRLFGKIKGKRSTYGKNKEKGQSRIKVVLKVLGVVIVIAIAISAIAKVKTKEGKADIISTSTLEKIVNVSDLSTFQAVYNGITTVYNEEDAEKVDFHVSYEAIISAGIDFEQVDIEVNEDEKKVMVTIPEVNITDINVDITTLDYIFENSKANVSTVSERAYKAAEADAKTETEKEEAIFELAEKNAQNILTALLNPFIQDFDSTYTLEIK